MTRFNECPIFFGISRNYHIMHEFHLKINIHERDNKYRIHNKNTVLCLTMALFTIFGLNWFLILSMIFDQNWPYLHNQINI